MSIWLGMGVFGECVGDVGGKPNFPLPCKAMLGCVWLYLGSRLALYGLTWFIWPWLGMGLAGLLWVVLVWLVWLCPWWEGLVWLVVFPCGELCLSAGDFVCREIIFRMFVDSIRNVA